MRHLAVTAGLLLIAAPASSQIVRVSVSTAGDQANNGSFRPSISADGRFVVFASAASNLVAEDANNVSDIFLRDRDTDADGVFDEAGAVSTTRLSLGVGGAEANGASNGPVITPDGRYVVFESQATNLVDPPGPPPQLQVYRVDRTSGTTVLVSAAGSSTPGAAFSSSPVVSADGNVVAFISRGESGLVTGATPGPHVFIRDIAQSQTRLAPEPADWATSPIRFIPSTPSISDDGSRLAYLAMLDSAGPLLPPSLHTAVVADLASGTFTSVPVPGQVAGFSLSASGSAVVVASTDSILRRIVATGATTPSLAVPAGGFAIPAASPGARYAVTSNALLHDFDLNVSTSLGFVHNGADFSANARWLTVDSGTATLVAGDTNGVDDVFVVDLPDLLDADNDTMDDRWETLFGVTDPSADPDGDGQTNAQEEDAGTHPNGQVRRFLAEGATGSFFHTTIALANPSPTLAATAVLTLDKGDGTRVRRSIAIPAGRSAAVDLGAITGLETSDVSTTVESDRVLGIERSMTWGASGGAVYGSHAETATPEPSPTWFLAEGSTVLGFDLFYLLQNPQATTTHATVNFLLPSGTTITKTYDLPPGSRTTIYVNQVEGLDETDVSGDITADAPIVVERSMYRSTASQPFALGSDSMGVTAPATSWFLAEGATGTFFDLYVLIANPGNTAATVRADYARPDGSVVTQTYNVGAHSRHSVYVDAIPGLENTSVATRLTSMNAVPIVAERAMYWPGGFFDYYEGHSSAGSTTTALEWVVAGGESRGPAAAQTFVLIANTENRVGQATLTILPAPNGPAAGSPVVTSLPPNSRTTIPLDLAAGRFGVRVQSTGASPVQLVVESAVYRSADGVLWSAGSNALATPVVP
jgi:hypothetical protein